MSTARRIASLSAIAISTLVARPALPAESIVDAQAHTEHLTLRLLSEESVVAPGATVSILLDEEIVPHWHTYWRNPGDSGEPTAIAWKLPAGATAGTIQWPVPERIAVGPLVDYGYSDHVALISDVHVPSDWPAGQAFPIVANATWLVCSDVCIPESHSFSLDIPSAASGSTAAAVAPIFAAARASQPSLSAWPTRLANVDGTTVLTVSMSEAEARSVTNAQFFPAVWGVIDHAGKQSFSIDHGALALRAPKGDLSAPAAFSGIVVLDEARAGGVKHIALNFDATAAAPVGQGVAAPSTAAVSPAFDTSLILVLLSALFGGVLLNLMPCVFPVLAMKALALLNDSAETHRLRLARSAAYTLGILVAFAICGAALLALKAGGSAVGWGFQLQNPLIVALLAYILFVAGLNLSGVFEFGGRLMGVGASLAARPGLIGSFFTGVLAAVVATPCTAPFMASALGVALTESAPVAIAIFLTLGVGLALPFLMLSLFPSLARVLPRPGTWMNTLRQALAFPMYASAAWLVWVLAQQQGADGVFEILLGMLAIAFACWLGQLPARRGAALVLRRLVALGAVAGSLALPFMLMSHSSSHDAAPRLSSDGLSEPYSRKRLDDLLAAGKPVFVNMTAAWCITCKVNERVALSGDAFHTAVRAHGYTYLKGDWTEQNPEITQLLQSFGRAGVPLYVVYAARSGRAEVLPQVLTQSIVLHALIDADPTSVATSGDSSCYASRQTADPCSSAR